MGDTRKRYSDDEKRAMVAEIQARGDIQRVATKYSVGVNSLHVWKRQFAAGGEAEPKGETKRTRSKAGALETELESLRTRVADLERLLGRKLVELELAKEWVPKCEECGGEGLSHFYGCKKA